MQKKNNMIGLIYPSKCETLTVVQVQHIIGSGSGIKEALAEKIISKTETLINKQSFDISKLESMQNDSNVFSSSEPSLLVNDIKTNTSFSKISPITNVAHKSDFSVKIDQINKFRKCFEKDYVFNESLKNQKIQTQYFKRLKYQPITKLNSKEVVYEITQAERIKKVDILKNEQCIKEIEARKNIYSNEFVKKKYTSEIKKCKKDLKQALVKKNILEKELKDLSDKRQANGEAARMLLLKNKMGINSSQNAAVISKPLLSTYIQNYNISESVSSKFMQNGIDGYKSLTMPSTKSKAELSSISK